MSSNNTSDHSYNNNSCTDIFDTNPKTVVSGLTVSQASQSLDAGETGDLDETISPANATDTYVRWNSSNTAIATVKSNGLVTA